jgi:hypothetical protein
MSAVRLYNRARLLSFVAVAALTALVLAAPALGDTTTGARHEATAKRGAASLTLPAAGSSTTASRSTAGFSNGFVYTPGPQPVLGFHGRFNVGKSGVYVPYYGNVGTDPSHPNVEGIAGIGYGFHGWDVSVVNGGFAAGAQAAPVPGGDTSKVNPSLSFSIRF